MNDDLFSFYRENKARIWFLLLVGIPSFLALGVLLLPEIFWESFLWRYFWGPVVADSRDHAVNGISEGYNTVNTITYGLVLAVAFLGIYDLMDHYDIPIEEKFVLSLLPWIILGSSLRSLEDVGLFEEPVSEFFISPIIYFLLGFSAIGTMIAAQYTRKIELDAVKEIPVNILLLSPPFILYAVFRPFLSEGLPGMTLLVLVIFLTLVTLIFAWFRSKKGWRGETYLFSAYGSLALIMSLTYNVHFLFTLEEANPMEMLLIPIFAGLFTLLLLGVFKAYDIARGYEKNGLFSKFTLPLNLAIVVSHLLDATATTRGMAAYGYVEKHVLPTFLIELTGTPLVMIPMKAALVFLVVYVLDVLYEEEMMVYPGLKKLIKFVVIVLGLAPSLRNTFRLAMGV
uniref:Membrane protein containing DUF63 n=1 Tax=uncultured organism TaxID=155900 RepID=M1QAJ7_9ZZZZ|nr:membrane protein containing DUF63 [uncultured organism]